MHQTQSIRTLIAVPFAVLTALLLMGCSSTQKIQSAWQPVDTLRVDGQTNEWDTIRPQYYDEDSRLAVRTMNNEDDLFICLTVGSRNMARKVMHSGLTLTLGFDNTEGQDVALTIKPGEEPEKSERQNRDQPRPQNAMTAPAGIAITVPPSVHPTDLTPSEARKKGIEMLLTQDRFDRLILEARLNLKAMALLANTTPGTSVTLEITSPETTPPKASGGKRAGGKGRRGGRGSSRSAATPLKAELEINLASSGA
ncbi:hypothetical protein [Desulfoluna butyratoxydans]|uniref:Uncharacterized protein n=1 Tax=Desulfoluna butyratoxydans TaxID=231438 RepID=A0A4U8YN43_9BACT|nr:hypothetical protein [Desulfoluna butyratoxydans]VFQ45486.1 hypothetical protein MSL71_31430 [Desulfoluna butyratoxydans]